ncbi:oxidoreductase isoform X4 [Zea mays]|uniref:oxidoreductase isoform X4 n=1 Tax=Zea mays TaxID=4577 RepID=UPI0009A9A58A|nr:oxidoreductase isoform X4 [Zea mays]|eukprot:XP_020403344.1 oxidoreductase isoform X4 [Zea mays]
MALCAVCGPDTHTDSLAAGRRLRRRKWRPVPARRRRQIGDRATISSEAGAGKIRKLRCRSGCCRGCSACSNRGRRWASTRPATATSPALRRSTAQGTVKERRWVEFKGADQDSTTVPGIHVVLVVEWICWLNGQRKKAPTPEELAELEARRERVKQNIQLLKKKEEEERKTGIQPVKKIGKAESPNLQSFVKQQFSGTPPDQQKGPEDRPKDTTHTEDATTDNERYTEPTGTGATFKPGTWQPPT